MRPLGLCSQRRRDQRPGVHQAWDGLRRCWRPVPCQGQQAPPQAWASTPAGLRWAAGTVLAGSPPPFQHSNRTARPTTSGAGGCSSTTLAPSSAAPSPPSSRVFPARRGTPSSWEEWEDRAGQRCSDTAACVARSPPTQPGIPACGSRPRTQSPVRGLGSTIGRRAAWTGRSGSGLGCCGGGERTPISRILQSPDDTRPTGLVEKLKPARRSICSQPSIAPEVR